eukprot:Clim_evm11s99 gene=Clim_evmTU11s99
MGLKQEELALVQEALSGALKTHLGDLHTHVHRLHNRMDELHDEVRTLKSSVTVQRSSPEGSFNIPAWKEEQDEYPESVLADTVMKCDHWAGIHKLKSEPLHPGVFNFRQHPRLPIFGVNQCSADGVAWVVQHLRENLHLNKVVWVNLREEPVVYINGLPHSPREPAELNTNVEYLLGIEGRELEKMERRLKYDIVDAAAEDPNNMFPTVVQNLKMENVMKMVPIASKDAVRTVRDIYRDIARRSSNSVTYVRIPIQDESAPEEKDFQEIYNLMADFLKPLSTRDSPSRHSLHQASVNDQQDEDPELVRLGPSESESAHVDDKRRQSYGNSNCTAVNGVGFVFNCQMGRGRTTTAMVLASLLYELMAGVIAPESDHAAVERERLRSLGHHVERMDTTPRGSAEKTVSNARVGIESSTQNSKAAGEGRVKLYGHTHRQRQGGRPDQSDDSSVGNTVSVGQSGMGALSSEASEATTQSEAAGIAKPAAGEAKSLETDEQRQLPQEQPTLKSVYPLVRGITGFLRRRGLRRSAINAQILLGAPQTGSATTISGHKHSRDEDEDKETEESEPAKKMARMEDLSQADAEVRNRMKIRRRDSLGSQGAEEVAQLLAGLSQADLYAKGYYAVIVELIQGLPGAARGKLAVDEAIDDCETLQNLRTCIRDCIMSYKDHDFELVAKGLRYLERYWYIIVFATYAQQRSENESSAWQPTFMEWMRERWSLKRMLKNMRLK